MNCDHPINRPALRCQSCKRKRAASRAAKSDYRHRSVEPIDTVDCKQCGGSVRIKVFGCELYGQCTVAKRVPEMACCKGCGGCG